MLRRWADIGVEALLVIGRKLRSSSALPCAIGEPQPLLGDNASVGHTYLDTESSANEQHASMLPFSPQTVEERCSPKKLCFRETLKLSLEFCFLWFAANYSVAAGLEYTSVGSSTILVSTSSVWTLVFGVIVGVETFSYRKFSGVFLSLAGIVLISTLDYSGETNRNRGRFPQRSGFETAVGDILSLGSAIMYGIYSVLMKKRIADESSVDMLLFFGLVGLINTILLWPGFVVLHLTGLETFELPATCRVWRIVIVRTSI